MSLNPLFSEVSYLIMSVKTLQVAAVRARGDDVSWCGQQGEGGGWGGPQGPIKTELNPVLVWRLVSGLGQVV